MAEPPKFSSLAEFFASSSAPLQKRTRGRSIGSDNNEDGDDDGEPAAKRKKGEANTETEAETKTDNEVAASEARMSLISSAFDQIGEIADAKKAIRDRGIIVMLSVAVSKWDDKDRDRNAFRETIKSRSTDHLKCIWQTMEMMSMYTAHQMAETIGTLRHGYCAGCTGNDMCKPHELIRFSGDGMNVTREICSILQATITDRVCPVVNPSVTACPCGADNGCLKRLDDPCEAGRKTIADAIGDNDD